MSFILDALKKSERARQRQAGPSLFEVKVAAPRRAVPAWAVALGVLLVVINAAVIGWIVLRRPVRRAASTASAVPAASLPATQVRAASEPSSPPAPARASANPGGGPARPATALNEASQNPGGAGAAAVPAQSRLAATAPATGPGGSGRAPAASARSADYAPAIEPAPRRHSDAKLPLYRQLESAPGSALPRLHLDLHVYESDPSKRFVMINMHQLKKGGSLPDGVKVISIRPDGVVLSYDGRRFLLPR